MFSVFSGNDQRVYVDAYVPVMAAEYHRGLGAFRDVDGSAAEVEAGLDQSGAAAFPAEAGVITWPVGETQAFPSGPGFLASFMGKATIGTAKGGSEYRGSVQLHNIPSDFADYPGEGKLGEVKAGEEFSYSATLDSAFPVTEWSARAVPGSGENAALPAGLQLDGNGTISGAPEAPGDFTFALVAADAWGNEIVRPFSLTVHAADAEPNPVCGVPTSRSRAETTSPQPRSPQLRSRSRGLRKLARPIARCSSRQAPQSSSLVALR